jgi:hypothetical protein
MTTLQTDKMARPIIQMINSKWRNEARVTWTKEDITRTYNAWRHSSDEPVHVNNRFRLWMTYVDMRDSLTLGTTERVHSGRPAPSYKFLNLQ